MQGFNAVVMWQYVQGMNHPRERVQQRSPKRAHKRPEDLDWTFNVSLSSQSGFP